MAPPTAGSILLECPSGIAGNMWLAAMLALGVEAAPIRALPTTLGLGRARLAWKVEHAGGVVRTDLEVVDTDPSVDGTFADLTARIAGADLPADVGSLSIVVAGRRRDGDAGSAFASRRWWGEEFTDTLVDVVGGVLAWHLLGRPVVRTRGPVALGGAAGAALPGVLGPIPHSRGGPAVSLTTATGAALLSQLWQPGEETGAPVRRCEVHSSFVRRYDLAPMVVALHA